MWLLRIIMVNGIGMSCTNLECVSEGIQVTFEDGSKMLVDDPTRIVKIEPKMVRQAGQNEGGKRWPG